MSRSTNNPLVSIIVRTKDRPELLKRALQSIAAQTFRPIEVVLVNDGGCQLDVNELEGILKDITLNYIRLENNTGRAHAGNVGIENAKGEYIGFLDDDDEYYPEHIGTLVSFLGQGDYKVAYTDTEMVFQDIAPEEDRLKISKKIFSKDFSYRDLLIVNYIPFHSILFSHTILSSAGGLDENFDLYEDWDLLIRIGQEYPFYHVRKITTKYHQWSRDLQINRSNEDHMKAVHLFVIQKHLKKITPEMILNIYNEKEGLSIQIKNLMARESLAEKCNPEAREGDNRILYDEAIRERNKLIVHLYDANRGLEKTLGLITESIGWKALEKIRRLRERTFPQGSRRRMFYDLRIKSYRVISSEGLRGFFVDTRKKLRFAQQPQLLFVRKAYSVFKTYGLKTFLRYSYKYLLHGRRFLKTEISYSQDFYEKWIKKNEDFDKISIKTKIESLVHRPKISIITPVFNAEAKWLDKCIESVKHQFYDNWELCLHDDGSTKSETRKCLRKWNGRDERIKISYSGENQGISEASNRALKLATGSFIALFDNDDELSPDALYEVVKLLNKEPDTDLIYSDEDRIIETDTGVTERFEPFFKPDWSPYLLFACMYTGHLSVYRKSLVEELGGFRSEYDFSQDYDLALRVTERTNRIRHIQKVLYHWRVIPSSAAGGGKDFARRSNIKALKSALERRAYDAKVLEYPCANRVRFNVRKHPLVSIIIPTDGRKNIFNCIALLLRNTRYPSFEIIVVTNSVLGADILHQFKEDERIRVSNFDEPFNFSLKCNQGASVANGKYLLFLNDDVETADGIWLEEMAEVFDKGNVGGVSPKLFYEDNTIQYAGMVTGVRGLVGTAFHCQPKDSCTYFNFIQSGRNVSLLTGACLLMPKEIFDEIGGFDAVNLPIMHSDIDLCFKLLESGYELIYTPFASLRHIGHLSLREAKKNKMVEKKDNANLYILKKWGDYLSYDPFYTENMKEFLYKDGNLYYKLIAGRQEDKFLSSKNILFVTHDLSLSGAPILMYYLACHLKKNGYFVAVLSPYEGELADKYRKENIPLMIDSTLYSQPFSETKKFMANFDLMVVNTILMWQSVFVAKENDIPVVWITHESLAGKTMADTNGRVAEALKVADDVIFACNATASLYERYKGNDNFRIIPYGTKPLEPGQNQVEKSEKFVILHIGSIEPRKGQDILIQSILNLPKRFVENIEVYIIGRNLDVEEYKKIKKMLRTVKNIHLLGQIPHEKVVEFFDKADLFVCSSRDEVFPLTLLEAMSVGKAIISTNVGGVSEMIRNNEEGVIVPKGDSLALADKIQYLHDNRDEIKRLGGNARKKFYENFTIEKFGDNVLDIVKKKLADS